MGRKTFERHYFKKNIIINIYIFLIIILNIKQLYQLIPPEYAGGLFVVLLISVAKLSDSIIGNNNAILFNSDYYRVVLALGVLLAIMTVIFNILLIPKYGINGAGFATFMSIVIYNTTKVGFVYYKFNMSPFCLSTFKTLILIIVFSGVFYYWDFSFHPIISIGLKSVLIGISYALLVYKMNLSEDINILFDKFLKALELIKQDGYTQH